MLRSLCLILLTAFLICHATDLTRLLLAKKAAVTCESGTCDNETTEVEKINDDQLLTSTQHHFGREYTTIPLKQSYLEATGLLSEAFRNLFSPPPELA